MSGRKGSTTENVHPSRNKKRKFLWKPFYRPKFYGIYISFCKKTKKQHEHGGSHRSKFRVLHVGDSVFAVISETVICFVRVLKVMTTMGCPVDREAYTYVRKRDEMRSERRTSVAIKQESIETRAEQFALKEYQEEGVLYGPGISE
ncbi:hypothetical protein TNCV_1235111 [Trichonephila clavipes]|nr:hypothetical protein TNCV_1235111 [Trichonephila clavipes]